MGDVTRNPKAVTERLELRIASALADGAAPDAAEDLLAEGYARALRLDAERLKLERTITALAARADEPAAAQELRRAWLRHRTLLGELSEMRALLRRLKAGAAH
jgi:hypothetical protein